MNTDEVILRCQLASNVESQFKDLLRVIFRARFKGRILRRMLNKLELIYSFAGLRQILLSIPIEVIEKGYGAIRSKKPDYFTEYEELTVEWMKKEAAAS